MPEENPPDDIHEEEKLSPDEAFKGADTFRRRIIKALTDYPDTRVVISNPDPQGSRTESISWPNKENPQWIHVFSRISKGHYMIRSQSPTDPDLIEEDLEIQIDEGDMPTVTFKRIEWKKPPQTLDNVRSTISRGDIFISRIESQLNPKKERS